ncbi:MAG TPA: hypothetical protein VMH00_06050 [Candidatus Limnocylindrales bacterium]|nr:hypothetical protein [Candidatus Limnocylindrales bacterium]
MRGAQIRAAARREALLDAVWSAGGLAAVYGGIEILNWLVSRLHWN